MRTLRFVALSGAVLAAATATLIACGDDDGVFLDVPDSGLDVQQPDVNQPSTDSGPGADVNVPDTGITDAGDQDADAALTFFDASTYDAGPDAGFAPDAGPAAVQLADVFCNTLARCCFGDSTLQQGSPIADGGSFNRTQCLIDYGTNGFEQANTGASVDTSHIIVDQTGSNACAQKLQALSCNLGFAEFDSVRQTCYSALVGTQGPGESCTVSAECQKGLFCGNPDAGSGSGTCAVIRTTGQPCGDENSTPNDSQTLCSYRYSGEPARHCADVVFDGGVRTLLPKAQWNCADDLPLGASCPNSAWCSNGICDFDTRVCVATTQYFPPSDCTRYRQ